MHSKLLIADDNTVIIGEEGLSGGVWGTRLYLDQSLPIPQCRLQCHGLFYVVISFMRNILLFKKKTKPKIKLINLSRRKKGFRGLSFHLFF